MAKKKKKKETLTFTLDYKKLDETKNYFLEEVKHKDLMSEKH